MKRIASTTLVVLLSACTHTPITYETISKKDMESCTALADRYTQSANLGESRAAEDVLVGTATGALVGAAIDQAAKKAYFLNGINQKVVVHFGSVFVPFAIAGAILGFREAAKEHDKIVRACLYDKGYRTY